MVRRRRCVEDRRARRGRIKKEGGRKRVRGDKTDGKLGKGTEGERKGR